MSHLLAIAYAAPSTTGVTSWLKANIIPLGILVVGVGILLLAGKQNHRAAMGRTSIVVIALAVIGLAGAWQPVSSWIVHSLLGL